MELYDNRSLAESATYAASRQILEKGVKAPSLQDLLKSLVVCTASKVFGPMVSDQIPGLKDMEQGAPVRRAASLIMADGALRLLSGNSVFGALKPAPIAAAGAAAFAGNYANGLDEFSFSMSVAPDTEDAGPKKKRTPAEAALAAQELAAKRRQYSDIPMPEGI